MRSASSPNHPVTWPGPSPRDLSFPLLFSHISGLCILPRPGAEFVTNKTSPTLLLAKSASQPTHKHRPLSYFQSERGQISPRVLTL